MKLVIDQEVIEFYGSNGTIYGAVEVEENILSKLLMMENFAEIHSMEWYELCVKCI